MRICSHHGAFVPTFDLVDDAGHPVTAAIDMMDCDEDGLRFLTAHGKGFYRRLTERRYLALGGMVARALWALGDLGGR